MSHFTFTKRRQKRKLLIDLQSKITKEAALLHPVYLDRTKHIRIYNSHCKPDHLA